MLRVRKKERILFSAGRAVLAPGFTSKNADNLATAFSAKQFRGQP
jgi:hypothetical protein